MKNDIILYNPIIRSSEISNVAKAIYIYISNIERGFLSVDLLMYAHKLRNKSKKKRYIKYFRYALQELLEKNIINSDIECFKDIFGKDFFYIEINHDAILKNFNDTWIVKGKKMGAYSLIKKDRYYKLLNFDKNIPNNLVVYAVMASRMFKEKNITHPNCENKIEMAKICQMSERTFYTRLKELVNNGVLSKIVVRAYTNLTTSYYFNADDPMSIIHFCKKLYAEGKYICGINELKIDSEKHKAIKMAIENTSVFKSIGKIEDIEKLIIYK